MTGDFPEYSEEGKLWLSIVHQYWAHAVFYFEDESHEIFYERLIRRIIPNVKDFLVVCLGGKSEIYKAIKSPSNEMSIPGIFIVDKDYDDFTGELGRNRRENLIYLRRHSIENYLAQFDAVLEVILEQKAGTGIAKFDACQKISNSAKYYSKLSERLQKIGRYFLVARKNGIPVRTSKISCSEIYRDSDAAWPLPTDEWIDEYVAEFKGKCALDHEWLLQEDVMKVQLSDAFTGADTPWGNLPIDHHIVGKHLVGGIIRYMDSCFETKLLEMKDVELYTRLASHIDTTELEYLKDEILQVAPMLVSQ